MLHTSLCQSERIVPRAGGTAEPGEVTPVGIKLQPPLGRLMGNVGKITNVRAGIFFSQNVMKVLSPFLAPKCVRILPFKTSEFCTV